MVIAVPEKLQTEFTQLFVDSKDSFDSIYKKCTGFSPVMIGDSLQTYFGQSKVNYIIFFVERKSVEKQGDIELWMMTNKYGPGQPCWPGIYIKRISINNVTKLLFISVNPGMCEI